MSKYHEALGKEKISTLLVKQSTPAVIGLLVMSLYNIVDTIFIGQGVGSIGIAGLAVAFPIQMIIMAISMMVGIGASSIISRRLGAKQIKEAERTLGNSLLIVLAISFLSTSLGLIFIEPLLKIFGATENILPHARDYLSIILYGSFFLSFAASGNNIIRAEGNAKFAMGIMLVSSIVNLILDPIFIFGLDMGMTGAAVATVIAQITAAMAALYYFMAGKGGIRFHFANLKPKFGIVKEMFAIGASSFARQSATSLVAVVMNHSLGFYGGDVAIAAYGLISRILMLVFMPIFGIVQGMQPILGYNYGAKYFKRVREVIMLSMKSATIIAVIAFTAIMLFSRAAISAFTSDQELINLAVPATRIVFLIIPLIGFQVVAGGLYQAVGKPLPAFFTSLLRQIILLIPAVLILPHYFDLNGLWIAFPVVDFLSAAVIFLMVRRELKVIHLT